MRMKDHVALAVVTLELDDSLETRSTSIWSDFLKTMAASPQFKTSVVNVEVSTEEHLSAA